MHCTIVLAFLVFSAACLNVVTGFHSKKGDVSKENEVNNGVEEDIKLAGYQYSFNARNRKRRSIWTSIINHISDVVKPFHLEPLLVEGVNDVDGLGKNVKSKFRDTSKSVNIMSNKGESSFKSGKRIRKKVNLIVDPDELEKVKKEMSEIVKLHFTVENMEEKLQNKFVEENKHKGDINDNNLLLHLSMNDSECSSLELVIREGIKMRPNLADEVQEVLKSIRKLRHEMQYLERKFHKTRIPHLSQKFLEDNLYQNVIPMKYKNDRWLANNYFKKIAEITNSQIDPDQLPVTEKLKNYKITTPAANSQQNTTRYKKVIITNKKKLKEIRQEMRDIKKIYDDVTAYEKNLVRSIVGESQESKDITTKPVPLPHKYYPPEFKLRNIIMKKIKENPEFYNIVRPKIIRLRNMRSHVQILERKFTYRWVHHLAYSELEKPLYKKLAFIRYHNNGWLKNRYFKYFNGENPVYTLDTHNKE